MLEWKICGRGVCAFPAESDRIVYLNASPDVVRQIAERVPGVVLVAIDGVDWNRDLTPWPAKAVFRGQPDFGGGAAEYLEELPRRMIPEVEERLGIRASSRMIAGYSLAGMFAVYAALETELFDGFASVSGSLWYAGFAEYAKNCASAPGRAYFSVGDRERRGRNRAFHAIEECTKEIERSFRQRGSDTIFELNPGGHFDDPAGRMARAVRWLTEQK